MRSEDAVHTDLVLKLYAGRQLDFNDLSGYQKLEKHDLEGDFKTAPIIVRTNRERFTLNHFRSIQFAQITGQVVIRWRAKHSHWEQRPLAQGDEDRAMLDPAFFEYFVMGAPGHIFETLNRDKRCVNGTRFTYHSLSLISEQRDYVNLKLRHVIPGDVITLAECPYSVNVTLIDEQSDTTKTRQWRHVTLVSGKVVVPILPHRVDSRKKKHTPIPGNLWSKPSRVIITPNFPLTSAFAITVDKAQGMTLD